MTMERLLAQASALDGMLAIPLTDVAECTIGELDRRVRKIENRYNVIPPDPAVRPTERGLRYRLDALTARSPTPRKNIKQLELVPWTSDGLGLGDDGGVGGGQDGGGGDDKISRDQPDMETVLRAWYSIDPARRIPATDAGRLRVISALAWQCGSRGVQALMLDAYTHADLFSWATALHLHIEGSRLRSPMGLGVGGHPPPPPPGFPRPPQPMGFGPPPPLGPPPPFYSGPGGPASRGRPGRKAYTDGGTSISSSRSSTPSTYTPRLPWWKKLWRRVTGRSRSRFDD